MIKNKEKKNRETFRLLGVYSIAFLVFFLCAVWPFIRYGKAFLWRTDGISQHYPGMLYTWDWVHEIGRKLLREGTFEIPFWELRVGLGMDVLGNTVFFRIVNFLFAFFRRDDYELFFVVRAFLNLYLSGLAFIVYIRTKIRGTSSILLGTFSYVFCAFALFFMARHTFFLEMMIFLPLMCLGVDQLFDRKHSPLFVITVFLGGASYFYFLYIDL